MIVIGLGSNVSGIWGTPAQTIGVALRALNEGPIALQKSSTPIITAPFGNIHQPDFVNAVAIIKTALSPLALLRRLNMIERQAGRRRGRRWGPRTLDLDILDYNGLIIRPRMKSSASLTLPHAGIAQRMFVLQPIAEIAPRWRHPITHRSAAFMIQKL